MTNPSSVGAEAIAFHLALSHGMLPLRIYTDCQATVDGVGTGRIWAETGGKMQADVWVAIHCLLEEMPGVEVIKVKGHATERHVESGESTWWKLGGNKAADELAKQGARQHPHDEQLAKVWEAYDYRILTMSKFLGRLTENAQTGHRDNQSTRARRNTGWQRKGPRTLKEEPPSIAWSVWNASAEMTKPHRLWKVRADNDATIYYCSRCGGYADSRPRKLMEECRPSAGGLLQLTRLKSGRYPHLGRGKDSVKVLEASVPASAASFWQSMDPGVQSRARGTGMVSREQLPYNTRRLSLQDCMNWVGLRHEDVEAHHLAKLQHIRGHDELDDEIW